MQARFRGFGVFIGAHQEAEDRPVVSSGFEVGAGHLHLEGDVLEVGAPAAVDATPLSEELAGVIAVEPLGLDFDDANLGGRPSPVRCNPIRWGSAASPAPRLGCRHRRALA